MWKQLYNFKCVALWVHYLISVILPISLLLMVTLSILHYLFVLSPRKEEEAKGDAYLEGARKAWFYLFMVLAPWQEAVWERVREREKKRDGWVFHWPSPNNPILKWGSGQFSIKGSFPHLHWNQAKEQRTNKNKQSILILLDTYWLHGQSCVHTWSS